jgi:hypothetical protein
MNEFEIDSITKAKFIDNEWMVFKDDLSLPKIPMYLFKYFSFNEYSMDSIENDYFYLSNPRDFNDPFDCNRNLIQEYQRELDNYDYVDSLNDVRDIGITCFSENELEPLLWSHYTNSYKGFCLKINVESFLSSLNDKVELRKVIYSDNPNTISNSHPFSDYYQFILKLNNWSYENEWRMIFKHPKLISNKINFDKNCIEEITVGYRYMENNQNGEKLIFSRFNQIIKEHFSNIPFTMAAPHRTKLELKKTSLRNGSVEEGIEIVSHRIRKLFGI